MIRITRAHRRAGADLPIAQTILTLALLLSFVPDMAGAQVLRIVDPPEWRESRPFTMQSRSPLRIAGFVSQAGGIQRVLVNGVAAMLVADAEFPDSYNFERVIPLDSLNSQFTITVEPRRGEAWSRSFTIELSTRPVDRSTTTSSGQGAGQRTAETQLPRTNPWGGFKTRGIVYGLAAVGGLVLTQLEKTETAEFCQQTGAGFDCFNRTTTEASFQSVGLAVAGGAAAIFLVDALLTSRKAGSPSPTSGRNDGFHLEAPSLTGSAAGLGIDLLRLRFR